MKRINFLLSVIFIAASMFACKPDDNGTGSPTSFKTTPYKWPAKEKIYTFPDIEAYVPKDNPTTEEGVKLGRYLFYDGRFSGRNDCDSMMSCASCHMQSNAFENGLGKGVGITGKKTVNTMLPMINLVFNPGKFAWNGSVPSIEADIYGVVTADDEVNGTHKMTVDMIKSIPIYPPMFKAAFGTEEINMERIAKAIAQFVRTLISYNSKFDKFIRHEINLTPDELRGYQLFNQESGGDCFHCHGTVLFTANDFFNNGKDKDFTNDKNRDRSSVTGKNRDIGAYKATTLRNIELTGPYMHDGRFKTLKEVLDFYSHGVQYSQYIDPLMEHVGRGGVQLNEKEKKYIIAFLKTLTDNEFISNPKFGRPAELDPQPCGK